MSTPLLRALTAFLLLVTALGVQAAPPEPRGDAGFWDAYWEGLLALRRDRRPEAIEAFTRAIQREPADYRPLLARGIVRALSDDFSKAREDVTRSRVLKSREPELWQYALDAMTGTSTGDRGAPIPHSLRKPGMPTHTFGGIPGHIVAGKDDYTTAYGSAVVYELAMPYRAAREAGKPTNTPALNAARTKVGRFFANRMLASLDLASRNFAEATKSFKNGDFVEARELLDVARAVYPYDPEMAHTSGDLWLKVGRPATARRDYTVAATIKTDLAGAYMGRAEAAAMLGDGRTTRADLANAVRYSGSLPAGLKTRVEAVLARRALDADPASILAEMDRNATDGTANDLATLADKLHRAVGNTRVRYDELYQDTIRRLEDAARADAKALTPRVELAQYLHDEADNRGEDVEPRRGTQPFRWQFSRALELRRALHYVEQALAIDAKYVPALVTKAYLLTAINRKVEAEQLLDQAMKLGGSRDADTVRLLATYRRRQVGQMLRAASALRTPTITSTTDTEHRSDGVWRIRRTTTTDPSRADLARAAALEREAAALRMETKSLMESAVELTRGTLDGLLLEAGYEEWFGSRVKALAHLEKAVNDHPRSLKAHDALIEYQRSNRLFDAASRQEATSWQLFETTAAPLLRLTWQNVREKGWPAMVKDLERARQLNPTDARTHAYLALARQEAGDTKSALALLKVAAALEKARLALDDQGVASKWPRPADDLACAMQVNQDLAAALQAAGKANEAVVHFVASGDLALRYPPDGVAALMFGAMRPNPDGPTFPAPAPVNGATLAARAHLGAGKALQAAGRAAEARKYFEAAARNLRSQNSSVPMVGTAKGDTNFGGFSEGASATALIELAKADIAEKRYKDAMKKLQDASGAKPTREERREINELNLKLLPMLDGRGNRAAMPAPPASRSAMMIETAKELIKERSWRAARQMLNRASQMRPTEKEKKEIEKLLEQIDKEDS